MKNIALQIEEQGCRASEATRVFPVTAWVYATDSQEVLPTMQSGVLLGLWGFLLLFLAWELLQEATWKAYTKDHFNDIYIRS